MGEKIAIRCKTHGCNRLLMNYYLSGEDRSLCLGGMELKCPKCRRIFRLKNMTEKSLIERSEDGVFRV